MGTGIWLVGARGSVATTAIAGAAALRTGAADPVGCVTEREPFRSVGLPGWDDVVFGGHDVVSTALPKRAEQLAAAGVLPPRLLELVADDLRAADTEIRPGYDTSAAGTQAAAAAALAADLTDFRTRHRLDRVIVVNVSSTEPPAPPHDAHARLDALRPALDTSAPVLPASALYAYAAFLAGCPFVDFTPSTGARLPALDEFAREVGLPYAGSDGKTGETLLRSVLAPMFASRALRVRSWSGTNLLGGGDGAALADPGRAASKVRSKQRVLAETLGYPVDGDARIDHVADLGEWKTAWDHVGFDGFLGVRMNLQFTWQGCDSALAAPLVLDLARLLAHAHRAGVSGPVPELAYFFKDPVGTAEHDLSVQFATLRTWAERL